MRQHYPLMLVIGFLMNALGCNDSSAPTITATQYSSEAVILGLGSIYVDGAHFTTERTQVTYEDHTVINASDLKPGMHIALEGILNTEGTLGAATKILYTEQLCGTIDAIDTLQETIEILGQTIQYNDNTLFYGIDENNLELELTPLTYVAINGFVDDQGLLIASRVAKKDDISISYRLPGKISNHDANAKTFSLGALSINYSNSTLVNLDANTLSDDLIVNVKGPAHAFDKINMVLSPEVIQLDVGSQTRTFVENSHRGVEGLVNNITTSADFYVRGIHINTDGKTVFKHGAEQDIQTNARVMVKGTFNAQNTLIAEIVVFQKNHDLKIKGVVDAIDYTQKFIVVDGVTYQFSMRTYTEDHAMQNRQGLLAKNTGFVVGDYVELEGFAKANNQLFAGKITLEKKPKDFDTNRPLMLRGEASSVIANGLTVQGKEISYNADTVFFSDIKVKMTQSAFNTSLITNKNVYVYAEMINGILVAKMMGIRGLKVFADKRPKRLVGHYNSASGTSSDRTLIINNQTIYPHSNLQMRTITGAHVVTEYSAVQNFITAIEATKTNHSLVEVLGYLDENDSKFYAHELTFFELPQLMQKPYEARPGGLKERDPNQAEQKDPKFGYINTSKP